MPHKFAMLEERVEVVLARFDELRRENDALKEENRELTAQVKQIRRDLKALKLTQADKSETINAKLISVLDRVKELEAINW